MLNNIFKKAASFPVILYQKKMSASLHASGGEDAGCRFQGDRGGSCSEFALAAINKHGALKGYLLSINRFAACTPDYIGGDHYPVPENVSLRALFRNMRIKENLKIIKTEIMKTKKLKIDPGKLDLRMFFYPPDYMSDELSNNPSPPAHE